MEGSPPLQTSKELWPTVEYHLAIVFDGTKLQCYIAGKFYGSVSIPSPSQTTTSPVIGGALRGGNLTSGFAGILDEIRISQVARYTDEFAPPQPDERFQPDDDTLALYHCDEGTGEVLLDSSQHQRHGKVVGAKWVNPDGSPISKGAAANPLSSAIPGQSVDLLKLIDFSKLPGFSLTNGELAYVNTPGGDPGAMLQIPHTPPEEYQVMIVARRAAGKSFFNQLSVGLSAKDRKFKAYLGSKAGVITGFYRVNDKIPGEDPASPAYNEPIFVDDAPKTIVLMVRKAALTLAVDGKEVVRVPRTATGPLLSLDVQTSQQSRTPLFLQNAADFRISKLELTPLGNGVSAENGSHALDFDGVASRVRTPVTYDGSHPLTIEAWVTPRAATHYLTVLSDERGEGFTLSRSQANWTLTFGRTKAVTSASFSPELTHVAGTFDGRQLQLFVSGKDQGVALQPGYKASGIAITIGSNPAILPRDVFDGVIDEVRISKFIRYRTAFEPDPRFEPDADTLALYHFDEGSGDSAGDASANKNHGQIDGAKWVNADGSAIAQSPQPPVPSLK